MIFIDCRMTYYSINVPQEINTFLSEKIIILLVTNCVSIKNKKKEVILGGICVLNKI